MRSNMFYFHLRNQVELWHSLMKLGNIIIFFNQHGHYVCNVVFIFVLMSSIFFGFLYSMFPKSTHETFANKLYQTFKTNKRFIKPKLSRTDFTVSHYAGEVCYLLRIVQHKKACIFYISFLLVFSLFFSGPVSV